MRIWHGRHAAPLVIIWAIAIVIAALIYKLADMQPALSELLRPVYLVVFGIALLITWKWFRGRAGGKKHERRHTDRRHSDRRDDEDGGEDGID